MKLRPTPFTAATAGLVAALAWPLMWSRWGGPGADGGIELIVATLLVIALPAHAFVVGLGGTAAASARTLDKALLQRVAAWLAAAAGTALLRGLIGI